MSIRNQMLIAAVNAVRSENGALDVPTVAAKIKDLYPQVDLVIFDLRPDEEFDAAIAATNPAWQEFDAQQAPAPEVAEMAAEPVMADPPRLPDAGAPGLPTLQEAEQNLVNCRIALRNLSDDLRVKRGKLAQAITAWQTNGAPMTHSDLVRDYLKSEQAERVRKAREGYGEQAAAPTPGRSHLDRIASNSRGGSPDRGYSNSFRRGGRPVSQYGIKVPSTR